MLKFFRSPIILTKHPRSDLSDIGNLIVIKHEGSLITVYAHNNKNLVIEGGKVTKGSIIAEVGQTGNATSPHLHFEVRLAETAQNPLGYLPEIP